jgi:hypothetical protein
LSLFSVTSEYCGVLSISKIKYVVPEFYMAYMGKSDVGVFEGTVADFPRKGFDRSAKLGHGCWYSGP